MGIRNLHKQGITGEGAGIAIIDQGLLAGHGQCRDNLKLYELYYCADKTTTMHGVAVSSIAVGGDTGIAPGADLYYHANTFAFFFRPGEIIY